MAKVALRVVCAVLLVACVQGCFFLDLECKAKEFINHEASQLIGQAKLAFEQAMDHVFDKDILPLLEKAEAAIDAGIDKIDKDVNETIDHIESSIETIIHDAAQTANALASNLTRDIEEIISKAASAMEQVENTFYRDASRLLAKVNQIVQKGQCMEASGAKQLEDAIYKLLKSLNPLYRLSSCWRSLGYKFTMTLEDLTDIQLYNYQKECTLLNKITPNTPVEGPGGILETYAQGQLYAAEYYCIGETANAPAFQDVLSKEWLWWGVQYNTWKNIGIKRRLHAVEAGRGKDVHKLGDDPCGTPVECYAQAIKALNEAEQKILGLQTGLSRLNQTVIANQKEVLTNEKQTNASIAGFKANVSASIAGFKANVSANGQAISTNTKAIATNKNAITTSNKGISANTQKLSKLSVYPCNCNPTGHKGSVCVVPGGLPFPPKVFEYCDLCMRTTEEAAAYAPANPLPQAVDKESKDTDVPQGLQFSDL